MLLTRDIQWLTPLCGEEQLMVYLVWNGGEHRDAAICRWNCAPPIHMLKSWAPLSQNVALFGNGVIADVIN